MNDTGVNRGYIPYSKQEISEEDIDSVVKTLKSEYLTQGPSVPAFEMECNKFFSSQYSVAVNSASSGLHVACLALGVKKGDIVWTTPNTFVATANCAINCNAEIDFVDIDPDTFNISLGELEKKLINAKENNSLPKIVIPVHFAGLPCDLKELHLLSRKYNFKIIEDASHAVGSTYLDSTIGDCKYSDACVFSFHPVKIFTTGEGGLVTTNDEELAFKMSSIRTNGIVREKDKFQDLTETLKAYEQHFSGFNYRMNDISASLGLSQIKKVEKWNKSRNELGIRYKQEFNNIPSIKTQRVDHRTRTTSYHLFILLVSNRDNLYKSLQEKKIGVNIHYIPVHLHPFFKNLGFKQGSFPAVEEYYKKTITIPLFPSLTLNEQDYVISEIKGGLNS